MKWSARKSFLFESGSSRTSLKDFSETECIFSNFFFSGDFSLFRFFSSKEKK
jgi:hypothetical protein